MNLPRVNSFFLPHWWVEVFEQATIAHTTNRDTATYVSTVRFLPYLKPLQLKLASQLISIMQQQLLAGAQANIVITLPQIYNELQLLTHRQRNQAQLLLHELRTFRLLQAQENGALHTWSLFTDEIWHKDNEVLQVELQLAPWGRELLFGYCEPYADFIRQTQQGLQLRPRCAYAPLHLWKSVWLDVQGTEQLLYLRLEAAAQQHGNWLNLEHTLCQDLPTLGAGLELASGKYELLRLLTTLGKKLTEHGCLLSRPVPRTIFLDSEQQQQPQLLWTLARFATVQENLHAWQQAVCANLCTQQLAHTWEQLLRQLAPDRRRKHQQLLDSFVAWLKRCDPATDIKLVTMLTPGCPLLDIALFFEWSLRRMLPALALPPQLVPHAVDNALNADSGVPLHTRLANFRRWLAENPHFAQELRSVPQACLVSNATATLPQATPAVPQQTRAETKTEAKPTTAPDTAGNAHLHKIAALELQKIAARSRAEYNQLERDYFASLSPAARQSILEVKKHMQAGIFENHLRPRLISFMIANPSAWQRTDAVKELRVFD